EEQPCLLPPVLSRAPFRMKSKRRLALLATALLAAQPAVLPAADTPVPARPPLKLTVDRNPINRESADRVSYAPIVKKTVASVAYVYSTRKVQVQNLAPFLNDPALRRYLDQLPGRGESEPR